MLKVKKEGILLEKRQYAFEAEGVLNPALIEHEGKLHMFYRAVSEGNYSSIGYCRLDSPLSVEFRANAPLLVGQRIEEIHGIEDPRIVNIEGTFYLSYTAYDGVNALGALMVSENLVNFRRKGIIVPKIGSKDFENLATKDSVLKERYLLFNFHDGLRAINGHGLLIWDKNVIFFPRRINGKLCFLHRIRPDIQIVQINELEDLTPAFWANYMLNFESSIVLQPKHDHESSYIGGGCPPIEVDEGWLLIYHSVCDTNEGYVYSVSVALMDINLPTKEISRLNYPLFVPEEIWELRGEVNNVCFPTASYLKDEKLYIYYGAADERIAVASVNIKELIKELLQIATNLK